MFEAVTSNGLRQSLLPVSGRGAEDLMKLIAVGSLDSGPDQSLKEPDEERDTCVRNILGAVGKKVEFFTNHGHAEAGEEADFLTTSYYSDSLAATLYDICLIAVSSDFVVVAWRFEDA